MLGPRFSTVAPKLELLPCPNTKGLCRVVFTLLCRLSCLANGAIATEIFSCTIRHFQESSNRKPYKNTLDLQLTCSDQPTFSLHRSCVQFRVFLYGAPGRTRTVTLSHWLLRPACLPIPPPGHLLLDC